MNTHEVAREVISEACKRAKGDETADFTAVLNERFPVGPGGVGHANARVHAQVYAEIEAFYMQPYEPEPSAAAEWL